MHNKSLNKREGNAVAGGPSAAAQRNHRAVSETQLERKHDPYPAQRSAGKGCN